LKGPFSRADYQRAPTFGQTAVKSWKQYLPPHTFDLYYRDEIGNISTSHVWNTPEAVEFEIIPRFPLFGGWKTNYYFGYNLPLQDFLLISGSTYVLNVTFSADIENVVVDDITVKLILPEGVNDIKVHAPFKIDSETRDIHYTYLDTTGRPVVILKKSNLVREENQYFQVSYHFSSLSLLQEPFLLVATFFFFFLVAMIYNRLDFSIGPVVKVAEQHTTPAVAKILKEVEEYHKKILSELDSFNFETVSDKLFEKISSYSGKLIKVATSLETEGAEDLASKIRRIEQLLVIARDNLRNLREAEQAYRVTKRIEKPAVDKAKAIFDEAKKKLSDAFIDLREDL